jgi:hypothetical protein
MLSETERERWTPPGEPLKIITTPPTTPQPVTMLSDRKDGSNPTQTQPVTNSGIVLVPDTKKSLLGSSIDVPSNSDRYIEVVKRSYSRRILPPFDSNPSYERSTQRNVQNSETLGNDTRDNWKLVNPLLAWTAP